MVSMRPVTLLSVVLLLAVGDIWLRLLLLRDSAFARERRYGAHVVGG